MEFKLENFKQFQHKSGIYHIISGRHDYIGSSVNLHNRLKQHLGKLKHNCHHSRHLQNVFNKHGQASFEFEILEYCIEEQLLAQETYGIHSLKPTVNDILDPTRPIHSEESRKKQAENSRKKIALAKKCWPDKVFCYDRCGTFVKAYKSVSDAERDTHNSHMFIVKSANGEVKHYRKDAQYQGSGTKVDFLNDLDPEKPIKTSEQKPSPNRKPVYQYALNGQYIKEYVSCGEAEQMLGVGHGTISSAARKDNQCKSACHSMGSYEKHDQIEPYVNNSDKAKIVAIKVFNIETGEEKKYDSIADAVRDINLFENFDADAAIVSTIANKGGYYKMKYLCTKTDVYKICSRNINIYNSVQNKYYENSKIASEETGLSQYTIKKYCNDANNSEGNYVNVCARVKLRESGKLFK